MTRNLLQAIHPLPRIELRGALARAVETGQTVRVTDLAVELDGQRQGVDLQVPPVQEAASYLVVTFTPRAAPSSAATAQAVALADPLAQQLERELMRVKSRLRDVQEQHEVTIEEHKSSVEELQAINEESRSASEELETSREELQAINEELTTVNAELKVRVDDLDHSNGDLHNLMAATQIATVFLDRQLGITRYTPPAVGLFNLIPTDVGRPLTDLKHRLDYPELEADAARVLASLAPIERTISTPGDGDWFLARLQPYRTQDDHIAGVVLTFVDITERTRAGAALRESEARYHVLFAGSPVPFMVLRPNPPDFTVTAANDAYLAATLTTREGLIGSRLFDVFSDDPSRPGEHGSDALARSLERVLSSRRTDVMERVRCDFRTPAGGFEPHWWLAINAPILDASGRVSTIIHQVSRVTEIHHAEEAARAALQEAKQARGEAEAANRAKDHFLAVLSHELRTPLMPITMALATLDRRADLPESIRKTHEMIRRNVELEARFIDEMLDVTRIARGKMEIVRAPMDLHEAVRRAVEVSTPDIEGKEQWLTVRLEKDECPLSGDLARLQQVFWNLLKNASKFTPPGGAIEIVSRCREHEDPVVEVTDTGIGLDDEAAERIFQPFEQANIEITRQFGGPGLGLAIARATVEAHGGTLRASSPGPGRGATFTVRLPSAASSDADPPTNG